MVNALNKKLLRTPPSYGYNFKLLSKIIDFNTLYYHESVAADPFVIHKTDSVDRLKSDKGRWNLGRTLLLIFKTQTDSAAEVM